MTLRSKSADNIGNILKRLDRKEDPWAEICNKARPLDVAARRAGPARAASTRALGCVSRATVAL